MEFIQESPGKWVASSPITLLSDVVSLCFYHIHEMAHGVFRITLDGLPLCYRRTLDGAKNAAIDHRENNEENMRKHADQKKWDKRLGESQRYRCLLRTQYHGRH